MGYVNNGNEVKCIAWRLEKTLKAKHECSPSVMQA